MTEAASGGPRGGETPEPRGSLDALVAFLLYVTAPALAVRFVAPATDLAQRVENGSACMLAGIVAVVAFSVWRRRVLGWRLQPGRLWSYVPFLLLWVPFAMILYPIALRAAGIEFAAQEPVRYYAVAGARPGFWLVLLCTVVGAPVAEELLFRGFLFRAVEQAASARTAVVVTATLFGLIHGWTFAVPIGVLGLFFGYLRLRSGGVGTSILAHMVHNAWTVAAVTLWPDMVQVVYDK